jgi:hypothetical protein
LVDDRASLIADRLSLANDRASLAAEREFSIVHAANLADQQKLVSVEQSDAEQ